MPKKYVPPKGCPPELRALIEKLETKVNVVRALGVAKDTFTRVVNGGEKMPDDWLPLIERELSSSSKQSGPAFKPWDGSTRKVTLPPRAGAKARSFGKAPSMVADLLDLNDGNVSRAARAAGTTGNTIMAMITGKTEFNDARQRMVFSGLHGIPMVASEDGGPDRYSLGMAIVQVASKNYDRVKDMAAILNGRLLFRTSTPVGWLVIYRIKGEDARMFKRLAERDCSRVVCP